jgi:hypothetical protein
LIWPAESSEAVVDNELEETYLLPDESSLLETAEVDSTSDEVVVEFEDLELSPIEEDSELMFTEDVADDDSGLFDPAQTVEFESDEQKHDS